MELKEFWIRRYGPLSFEEKFKLKGFNLFFGINETGKTLTLEALTRLLLGSKSSEFSGIERVDTMPEGYILLQYGDEEIKLSGKNFIFDVTSLSQFQARNILIVRNSDLRLKDEFEFLTEVTDHLTGLQTQKINRAEKTLINIAGVTPTFSDLSNRKEDGKLKERHEEAQDLIVRIDNLLAEMEEDDFEGLESKWIEIAERERELKSEKDEYEMALNREKYERGKLALENYKKLKRRLSEIEGLTDEEYHEWRDCKNKIESLEKELENEKERLGRKRENKESLSDKINKEREVFENYRKRRNILEEIKPELKDLGDLKTVILENEESIFNRRILSFIAYFFLAISLVGYLIQGDLLFLPLAVFFSVIALTFIGIQYRFSRRKAGYKKRLNRIKMRAGEVGIKGDKPENLLSEIREFEEEYALKNKELQNDRKDLEVLEAGIDDLKMRIKAIEEEITENKAIIREIKDFSRISEIEEYREKLNRKENIKNRIEVESRALEEIFPEGKWEKKIEELEDYADKATHIDFREHQFNRISEELENTENTMEDIESKIERYQDRFKEIERVSSDILTGTELKVESKAELIELKDRLEVFIADNEDRLNNALIISEILDEIRREETSKICSLFEGDNSVSEFFRDITGGDYKEVFFDEEEREISVKRKDGNILPAWKLSGGTYDQLYFSIRISLGEKLLGGVGGFLILDDPFIKASRGRLAKLIKSLKDIEKKNWQIIYFSAKDEVKRELSDDILEGRINMVELPSLF